MNKDDKEFLESHKDILYYAKGHYSKSEDVIKDLQKLIEKRCGAIVSATDVYRTMVNLFLAAYRNNQYQLEGLFLDMFVDYSMVTREYTTSGLVTYLKVIKLILGKLSILQVKEGDKLLLDMGEPDYTILGEGAES